MAPVSNLCTKPLLFTRVHLSALWQAEDRSRGPVLARRVWVVSWAGLSAPGQSSDRQDSVGTSGA